MEQFRNFQGRIINQAAAWGLKDQAEAFQVVGGQSDALSDGIVVLIVTDLQFVGIGPGSGDRRCALYS